MTSLARAVGVAVAAAVAAGGVACLAAVTVDRPDALVAGTSTTVSFTVAVDDEHGMTVETGAAALWHACRGTVPEHAVTVPLARTGPDGYAVTLAPALGEHGARRLGGCLRDTTVDRVLAGDVTLAPAP